MLREFCGYSPRLLIFGIAATVGDWNARADIPHSHRAEFVSAYVETQPRRLPPPDGLSVVTWRDADEPRLIPPFTAAENDSTSGVATPNSGVAKNGAAATATAVEALE